MSASVALTVNTKDPSRAWSAVLDIGIPCACGAVCSDICVKCFSFIGCAWCAKDKAFHKKICGYSVSFETKENEFRMITAPASFEECSAFLCRNTDEEQLAVLPEYVLKALAPHDKMKIAVKGVRHLDAKVKEHLCVDNAMMLCRIVKGLSPVWGWRVRKTTGAYECSAHVLVADIDGTLYDLEPDPSLAIDTFVFVYSKSLLEFVSKGGFFPSTVIIRQTKSDDAMRAVIDLNKPLNVIGAMQYLNFVPRTQIRDTFDAITMPTSDQTMTGPRMIMAAACERYALSENIFLGDSALARISDLAMRVRNAEAAQFKSGRFPILDTYLALSQHTAPAVAIGVDEAKLMAVMVKEIDAFAATGPTAKVCQKAWHKEFVKVVTGTNNVS